MAHLSRSLVVLALVAASGRPLAAQSSARSPRPRAAPSAARLPCAGRTLERSAPIRALGRLPSGAPVTEGLALRCDRDALTLHEWGADSSAVNVLPRAGAMSLWRALAAARTLTASRAVVLAYRQRVGR